MCIYVLSFNVLKILLFLQLNMDIFNFRIILFKNYFLKLKLVEE